MLVCLDVRNPLDEEGGLFRAFRSTSGNRDRRTLSHVPALPSMRS